MDELNIGALQPRCPTANNHLAFQSVNSPEWLFRGKTVAVTTFQAQSKGSRCFQVCHGAGGVVDRVPVFLH